MTEHGKYSLQGGQYLGEISALCFLHLPAHISSLPYLLAGTGSELLLYDLETGKMMRSFQVFKGIRVHGVSSRESNCTEGSMTTGLSFLIAVFGERRVKLFTLVIEKVLNAQNQLQVYTDLAFSHSLPKFSHWVFDVCFLKDIITSSRQRISCVAIGCSDNSVCIWDILRSHMISEVRCPDRCLLYSLRMWGKEVNGLLIASGTIYNEIIVWKIIHQVGGPCLESSAKDYANASDPLYKGNECHSQQFDAVRLCRLVGHEGSIFRISWFSDGLKLVSVSDDRSARIWEVPYETIGAENQTAVNVSLSACPVLFGHSARVWDCCVTDHFIMTAGEDCTCRVWAQDGTQVKMIKEHIGRGVWRCLYDPKSAVLVSAGFDSAIKVHQLPASYLKGVDDLAEEFVDQKEVFTLCIPTALHHIVLTDSKSEYVRCLHFSRDDTLYVATNNGYFYHAKVANNGDAKWTELIRVNNKVPIVCMNLLSVNSSTHVEDWVALGDGKGSLTILRVIADVETPKAELTFTWSAEMERQLLGTYWCNSMGYRFIFTADPKGRLKLWRLCTSAESFSCNDLRSCDVCLIAEFISSFGLRIMCLDASLEEEVLVCGDSRGNLVLFPLLRCLLQGTSIDSKAKVSPLCHFKGVHGISSFCSISIVSCSSTEVKIQSTGGDGCICYLEYCRERKKMEFIGMKQVKELSLVQSIFTVADHYNDLASGQYAIGFASADFIVYDLANETKVVQIPCGGGRRPHSYYFGDVPQTMNCFAFVKNDVIYIHRHWAPDSERKFCPQNLHLQFHGREMHSLCFISEESKFHSNRDLGVVSKSSWIATGCEDGTVRLTRYDLGVENWSTSKLLGEHVGGSAVRSICSVSKLHIVSADLTNVTETVDGPENPYLLISVGAKRVLTAWTRKIRMGNKNEELLAHELDNGRRNDTYHSSGMVTSMTFQWLSTDMPTKNCSTHGKGKNGGKAVETNGDVCNGNSGAATGLDLPASREMDQKNLGSKYEDDWRYLAVTAFLLKVANSRISVCFVVVACSDTTVALRALVLPYRLWFDIALLAPLPSPVLALQHVIIPILLPSEDSIQMGNLYIVISGSTDGNISLWDLTGNIQTFMRRVLALQIENYIDCQKRPRTGRGSQGGRWWRSLGSSFSEERQSNGSDSTNTTGETCGNLQNNVTYGTSSRLGPSDGHLPASFQATSIDYLGSKATTEDLSSGISEVQPLHVLQNVHHSGVNCLFVSEANAGGDSSSFLCRVISGGDDQALHCLTFDLALVPLRQQSENIVPGKIITDSEPSGNTHNQQYQLRFLYHDKIVSAHSSAIKGVWTDGTWVFSTGLDQRVRCWHIQEHGKLTEHAHLIVSVPEPEALDARAIGRNCYQVAVAGRGMQMIFFGPGGIHNAE